MTPSQTSNQTSNNINFKLLTALSGYVLICAVSLIVASDNKIEPTPEAKKAKAALALEKKEQAALEAKIVKFSDLSKEDQLYVERIRLKSDTYVRTELLKDFEKNDFTDLSKMDEHIKIINQLADKIEEYSKNELAKIIEADLDIDPYSKSVKEVSKRSQGAFYTLYDAVKDIREAAAISYINSNNRVITEKILNLDLKSNELFLREIETTSKAASALNRIYDLKK